MTPVSAFLGFVALSAALAVVGAFVLFGLGWSLIVASVASAAVSGLIWKGIKASE